MALTKSIFGVYHPAHKAALLVSDLVALAAAFFVASTVRLSYEPDFWSIEYLGLSIIALSCLFIGGAYTSRTVKQRPKLPLNTFFIVMSSTLPSLLFIYILGPDHFTALLGRGVFPFAITGFGFLAIANRYVLNHLFHDQSEARIALLLSQSVLSERLRSSLEGASNRIKLTHATKICSNAFPRNRLNALVIAPDYFPNEEEQQALLEYRLAGVPIYSLSDFFESFLFLVPVQEINNDWFIRSQGFTMLHSSIALRLKRAVDIVGAIALLVGTLPITISTALLTKLVSRGPIFFSQTRVGMQGEPFTIYKFRTMQLGAETSGAQWARDNDSRVIPLGNFFRSSRIDELPQCWNIIKGDMSIVGPRPERPEFTSSLAKEIPYYDLRHVVKPGLTGWAQVSYPYGASTEDSLRKLQYDLYYIKNYSLLLDLNILLRTVLVTIRRTGR
jgi:exopolysaccharide biosynthesis polyprenyl glycosylphosphotransferase